jgi:hypothetical protein
MAQRESIEIFALLAAAYPKEPMTEPQVALYEACLAAYPTADVRSAVLSHIQQSPWFPKISDLVALLVEGDTVDADQAWAEVQHQIRTVGYYGQPTWSHPAIAQTVHTLGWDTLCTSTNPEADRAHFLRFYASAVHRTHHQRQRAGLGSMHDTLTQLGSAFEAGLTP